MVAISRLRSRLLLALFVAGAYLFLYTPIAILVIYSFNNEPFPAAWTGFTTRWYTAFWESSALWEALWNSVIIASSSTILSAIVGILLFFYTTHVPWIVRLFTMFYGTVIVPEIVLAVSLLSIFSFFSVPLGLPTLIVSYVVLGLGYMVPILYTRYKELDPQLIEASLDLGASQFTTFWRVIIPLLIPALFGASLLIFILIFDDFLLAFFCAGSETQTLSLYIFSMIRSGVSPVVNALSTVMLLMSSLLVVIFCALNVRTRIF